MARVKGTVTVFMDDKGFGFIQRDGGGADVFVHHSEMSGLQTLPKGQRVEFDYVPDPKGARAGNVQLLNE